MMSQLFLCLFGIFVGLTNQAERSKSSSKLQSSNGAMAAFSFIFFITYVTVCCDAMLRRRGTGRGISYALECGKTAPFLTFGCS